MSIPQKVGSRTEHNVKLETFILRNKKLKNKLQVSWKSWEDTEV